MWFGFSQTLPGLLLLRVPMAAAFRRAPITEAMIAFHRARRLDGLVAVVEMHPDGPTGANIAISRCAKAVIADLPIVHRDCHFARATTPA